MGCCRSVGISVLFAALLVTTAACSASHHAAAPTKKTPETRQVPPTTKVDVSVFVLGKARATASFIPAGFVAVQTARGAMPGHVTGPIPGTTNDAQYFLNAPARQSFVMSVYRGGPIVKSPWLQPSKQSVHGSVTYVGTNPITHQREFNWVVGPTTSAFVGGTRMSDALLLRIANSMVVAPS